MKGHPKITAAMISRQMKLAPDIDHIDGWVLLSREELAEGKRGRWYIAWHEVFTRKGDALDFAQTNKWPAPFKAVRGSLNAATGN